MQPPPSRARIIPPRPGAPKPGTPAVDPLWTRANNQVMQFMNPMLARLAAQRVAAEANARQVAPQHIAALQGQLQQGAGKMDESYNRGIVASSTVNDALANRMNVQGGAAQSDLTAKLAQIGAQDTGQIAQTYQNAGNAGFATGSADLQQLIAERAAGGAYQAKLVSGTLSLRADGTYSFQFGIRIEDSGNVRTAADSDGGLWNVNDNAITLASTQGDISRTGTVSGNVVTLQSSIRVLGLTKNRQ